MAKRGQSTRRFDAIPLEGKPDSRPVGASIEHSEGRLVVTISDAKRPGGRTTFDCSGWLIAPKLALLFADAMQRVLTGRSTSRTRYEVVASLRSGFFQYCGTLPNATQLDAGDLTQQLMRDFVEHIDTAKDGDGEARYALGTKRHFISALRSVITVLKGDGSVEEDTVVPMIKGSQPRKTPPLDRELYAQFLAECLGDCNATIAEIDKILGDAQTVRKTPRRKSNEDHQLAMAVADALDSYVILPERKVLEKIDHQLFKIVHSAGYTAVRRAAHPMAQELTPFVYYLAGATVFNAQPLMEIKLEDIIETRVLGVARLSLHPYKTRAHKHQPRSFAITDEPDNPVSLINFIKKWTSRARSVAPPGVKNNLFIYVPRNRKADQIVRPLYDRDLGMSREFLEHSIRYCKKRGYPTIGTRAMRATGADLADEVFEGDPVEVGALLGHSPPEGRNASYRNERVNAREQDRLAGAMAARTRWIDSNGKIDIRLESASKDRTAATPGFRCLDPFNSPIAGEKSGRLCAAYGFCPTCPLGWPDPDHAYAVARLLQLRERVNEALGRLGASVWLARIKAIGECIEKVWLPFLASDSTLDAARMLDLNPLPHLE